MQEETERALMVSTFLLIFMISPFTSSVFDRRGETSKGMLATVRKFLATIRISVLHRYYILTEVAVDN
jgi:hypothetical protein